MSAGRAYPHGIGLVLALLYVLALAWPAMAEGKPGSAGGRTANPVCRCGRMPGMSRRGLQGL
jgi:hypothetical protein